VIDQIHDPITRQQLPPGHMALARTLGSAQSCLGAARLQLAHKQTHTLGVSSIFRGAFVNGRRKNRQDYLPDSKKGALMEPGTQWRGAFIANP
jgi:hypothetical protein